MLCMHAPSSAPNLLQVAPLVWNPILSQIRLAPAAQPHEIAITTNQSQPSPCNLRPTELSYHFPTRNFQIGAGP